MHRHMHMQRRMAAHDQPCTCDVSVDACIEGIPSMYSLIIRVPLCATCPLLYVLYSVLAVAAALHLSTQSSSVSMSLVSHVLLSHSLSCLWAALLLLT